jgi:hypothetical protein
LIAELKKNHGGFFLARKSKIGKKQFSGYVVFAKNQNDSWGILIHFVESDQEVEQIFGIFRWI